MIMERNFNADELRSCAKPQRENAADYLVIGNRHADELSASWLSCYKD
jgi:hypothetical protein